MMRRYRLNESILDDIEATDKGRSVKKLADKAQKIVDSPFNESGNKRYRIGCPFMTTNDNFKQKRDIICMLYENFLEVLRIQHFTKDYVARVIFTYNNRQKYASYCENLEEFEKTVDMICAELHNNNYEDIYIDYICDFNPVTECSRNLFLRDWMLFKQAMYGRRYGIGTVSAYATTSSVTNKIKIDMTESKVPPYLPIMDFYCWLFGEKGGSHQKSELQYKKIYTRMCGAKLKILNIMDWIDEHPETFKDWLLEVVGYTTPTNASNTRTFTFRLYPKEGNDPTFDDVFDFVHNNILGRLCAEDIYSIFGEGAIQQYRDTMKIYIELPVDEIFEKHAQGMQAKDFIREFTVYGKEAHTVPVQLLRVDDDDIPHTIGPDGEMMGKLWSKDQYKFIKTRYENVLRKER